jgi:hypothetical protein
MADEWALTGRTRMLVARRRLRHGPPVPLGWEAKPLRIIACTRGA